MLAGRRFGRRLDRNTFREFLGFDRARRLCIRIYLLVWLDREEMRERERREVDEEKCCLLTFADVAVVAAMCFGRVSGVVVECVF